MNEKEILISGLNITPETIDDADNIYKYMGCDPEITKYTGWNPYFCLESTIEKIKHDLESEDTYSWVIKKDGEFIGTIGAYDYKADEKSIEIGYSIARHHWGKGYAGAAAKAVVQFLLNQPHIDRVSAWSHKDNEASRRVLLGAGLKEVSVNDEQVIYELVKVK
ncbi:MAG: GNAT family N-acetyltransferase [Eubacterium sp.]|nr:GNAT family N-acetyltransferase [Candidatus Colimonas fimequi]